MGQSNDSNGSYPFFGKINVIWNYNAAKQELTVSGTLSGKQMTSCVLKPGNKTGTITGQNGSNAATVGLDANFSTDQLAMEASQTDPARSGTGNSPF